MQNLEGCQIPSLPKIAEGTAHGDKQSLMNTIKRMFARPWNYWVKKNLKRAFTQLDAWKPKLQEPPTMNTVNTFAKAQYRLTAGDKVRVRSKDEILVTLNRFKELKGCAFLEDMWKYCGTQQEVLQPVERFLDERDYKVKKTRGVILLKGILCYGTPVFGKCDRACHLFWREEWLEKID